MKIEAKKEREKITLALSGELTIHHGEELKKAFLNAFDAAPVVKVEIGEAEDVDLSFVQTLLSAARTAAEEEKLLVLSGDGLAKSFRELYSRTGFTLNGGTLAPESDWDGLKDPGITEVSDDG